MRTTRFLATLALLLAAATGRSAPRPQQKSPTAPQPPVSESTIKTQTRLINVDVVVTDSHGNAVRGLKQDDFQVFEEHGRQQKIARFEFVDASANGGAAASDARSAGAPGLYSNIQSLRMRVAPTVILMDGLNTATIVQMQVHRNMILFLKNLPADTPVAVFLLGHTVHMVQNFTTDPRLLRSAIDRSIRPSNVEGNPQDDPNSPSNVARNMDTGMPESVIQALEDFEKEQYAMWIQDRVRETADAMKSIARYLGGYPGRKNLIWFSESFPLWIEPTSGFGTNPFSGSTSYVEKVRDAADALTNARVAVYPVDARGLEGPNIYSAARGFNRQDTGPGFAGALSREDSLRIESQATMDELADETGGKTCKNTNDLSGCVQRALDESSSYYELAYYPEGVKWDGRFHKVTVKTGQRGVRLAYRRGYFATDLQEMVKRDQPQKLLQQACSDALPSTSIPLTAQAVPPAEAPGQPGAARYLLTIPPGALNLAPVGGSRELALEMAICEFNPKGDAFQFHSRDLSRTVPEAVYQSWQTLGIRNIFDYGAKPEDQRLRFAVLDLRTGETGALDVPAHPHEFGSIPGPVVAGPPAAPAGGAAPTAAGAPAAASQQKLVTSLTFRSNSGQVSTLDWTANRVSYHGDLGAAVGAPAFFQKFLGAQYHCQAGSLVSNDANSTAAPRLAFVFRSLAGSAAAVDLTGNEPQYSGDLPVDPDARQFFDEVWKLCHCRQR